MDRKGNFFLPLDVEVLIPENDPVRLMNEIMGEMNYKALYEAYERVGHNEYPPELLFKVLVYGYMEGIYSSREIEKACHRDTHFMYLLNGRKPPDHCTIARFRSLRLNGVVEQLFQQLVQKLSARGELSLNQVFVDGTKFEANANRYSFVWKKSVEKHRARLQEKLKELWKQLGEEFGIQISYETTLEVRHLKKALRRLEKLRKDQGVVFVSGIGKRRSRLQRFTEQLQEALKRERTYSQHLRILGDRKSYAKTDHDATFMRMKDDHMLNGQLKPGYNVEIAVDSEYIVDMHISSERSDMLTFLPLMKKMRRHGLRYPNVVADAGFESEENYVYLEQQGQNAYIKPATHERGKTRKYRTDISLAVNMPYDEDLDQYTCAMGRILSCQGRRKQRSRSGYISTVTVYACSNCMGCEKKELCIRSRSVNPLEERHKTLYVSRNFLRLRRASQERITSEKGALLRMNRSIQVEGAFAQLKEDMRFRRFLLRSKVKVEVEFYLLCLAYNLRKLHRKRQFGRCAEHLHAFKGA